jgi:hypothetical protein
MSAARDVAHDRSFVIVDAYTITSAHRTPAFSRACSSVCASASRIVTRSRLSATRGS